MTFTLTEVLMLILSIGVTALVVIIARLSFQLSRTAAEVETSAREFRELVPPIRRLTDQATEDLAAIRRVGENTARIAEDVQRVTGEASSLTVKLLRSMEGIVVDRAHAAMAGARAGLGAWNRRGNGNGHGDGKEHENESSLKGER